MIKYWRDENCRAAGISQTYTPINESFEDIIREAKKILDNNNFACVEVVLDIDTDDEEALYLYDGEE